MAEERLIDEDEDKDKNKKSRYVIRVNEDGEEELVIEEREEKAEDNPLVVEEEEDDEEAELLTPEQYAEKRRLRAEEEERKNASFIELKEKIKSCVAKKDFESARFAAEQAEELKSDGELYCLKMRILSRDFTDFSALKECEALSHDVKAEATDEQKSELDALSSEYKRRAKALNESSAKLGEELEKEKSERREFFGAIKKSAIKFFVAACVPFVVFLVVAISLACTVMFASENGVMLFVTIGFAALAAIAFIAVAVAAHKLWTAASNYSANEKNTTTEVGRKYMEESDALKKLENVLSAFEQ